MNTQSIVRVREVMEPDFAVIDGMSTIAHALEQCGCGDDVYEARELLAFGAFLSAALVGLTVWGRSRLRQSSIELETDLRALAPDHRRHAEQHLIDDSLGLGVWWQIGVLILPLLAAIAVIIRV